MVDIAGYQSMNAIPVLDPQDVPWSDVNAAHDNDLLVSVAELRSVDIDSLVA